MSAGNLTPADMKVSVAMITYNHKAFIAQAIESVLMQQTGFNYELIIGEDCSTDGTRSIVRAYGELYPEKIHMLLPEHNLGMLRNFITTLQACRGQYIALLEGDDYWTDPHKLQKQVEFLEAHPDHAVSFHRTYQLVQATGELMILRHTPRVIKPYYTLDDLLRSNFIPTASVMFRNGLIPGFPTWFYSVSVGDWPFLILNAQHGKIGFIDQPMSVYRVQDGGMWAGAPEEVRLQMVMSIFDVLRTELGLEYEKQIKAGISDYFLHLAAASADRGAVVKAKDYLLKSIAGCPLNSDMRILDKLVLFGRLYVPPIYKALKRFQAWLHHAGKRV